MAKRKPLQLDEVLIERRQIGVHVRVAAIDPKSGTEVSVPGTARCPHEALAQLAVRKLAHVLARSEQTHKKPFFP